MSPSTRPAPAAGPAVARPPAPPGRHPRRGRRGGRGLRGARRRGRGLPLRSRRHDGRDRAPGHAHRACPRLVVRLRRRHGGRASATTCGPVASWDPDGGLRHNPAKLLLDPYARAVEGEVRVGSGGLRPRRRRRPGTVTASCPPTSTAGATCRAASSSTTPSTGRATAHPAARAARPSSTRRTCATRRCCTRGVPEELRGTYAGLAHPASVAHLLLPRGDGRRAAARARLHPRAVPRAPAA